MNHNPDVSPARVAKQATALLPGHPHVQVYPRTADEKRCPAYAADHFELAVYGVTMTADLTNLRNAVRDLPGIYRVTVLHGVSATQDLRDPDWPITYRDRASLRPQVRALWRSTIPTPERNHP